MVYKDEKFFAGELDFFLHRHQPESKMKGMYVIYERFIENFNHPLQRESELNSCTSRHVLKSFNQEITKGIRKYVFRKCIVGYCAVGPQRFLLKKEKIS